MIHVRFQNALAKLAVKGCGFIHFGYGRLYLHVFIPRPTDWVWGHEHEDYDDCAEYYGLGPLGMFVWENR